MWAFTKPSAGPMGARNREQVLPTTGNAWNEAPTPGSAPSSAQKQRRLPSRANEGILRQRANESILAPGLHKTPSTPTLLPRPSSATNSRVAPPRSAISRPMTAGALVKSESDVGMRQKQAAFSTAPTAHTMSGSLLSVNHMPGSKRAEQWMQALRADGYLVSPTASYCGSPSHKSAASMRSFSPMSNGQGGFGSVPASPAAMRRSRTFSDVDLNSGANSREHSPESRPGTGTGTRRLRGSGFPVRSADDDSISVVKPAIRSKVVRSIDRNIPVRLTSHLTSAAAMEVDRKYQKEMQDVWMKDQEQTQWELQMSIQRRQLVQFFSFLRDADSDSLVEGAERYVPPQLMEDGSIEADWSQTEIISHGPELEYSDVMEFNHRQVEFLRSTMRSYAKVSRPAGKVSRNLLDDGGPCADRLFRPTFARFLIDSRLVPGTGSNLGDGSQPYHKAVRIFDSVSRATQNRAAERAFVEQVGPTLGGLRSVTTEQCIAIVGSLLGKAENPAAALFEFFERDLPEAAKMVQALVAECKERTEAATKLVKEAMTDADYVSRRHEMMTLFGSPPTTYNGSMKEWIRGMKMWIHNIDESVSPEAIADRVESNFAVQNYLGDMIVEPGILHVADAYSYIFKTFFEAYYDEQRTCWVTPVEGGKPVQRLTPHMSAAGFFRFCIDFSVYPLLGCFDEVRAAYAAAESVEELGGFSSIERMKRAFNTVRNALKITSEDYKRRREADKQSPSDSDLSDDDEDDEDGIADDDTGSVVDSELAASTQAGGRRTSDGKVRPSTAKRHASKEPGDRRPDGGSPRAVNSPESRDSANSPGKSKRSGSKIKTDKRHSSQEPEDDDEIHRAPRRTLTGKRDDIHKDIQVHDTEATRKDTDDIKDGKAPRKGTDDKTSPKKDAKAEDGKSLGKDDHEAKADENKSPKKEFLDPNVLAPQFRRRSSLRGSNAEQALAHAASAAAADATQKKVMADAAVAAAAEGSKAAAALKHAEGVEVHPPVVMRRRASRLLEPGDVPVPVVVPVPLARRPSETGSLRSSKRSVLSEEEKPIRVKTCIDLSWIKKPFVSMTDHERRAYALLSAMGNCVADRFLCVRGLFLSVEEGGDQGLVDAHAIKRTLDKLRFEHDYTTEDMVAFVTVIDPKAEEGIVETSELEKAVGQVKVDQERRWPWLKEAGVGQTKKGGAGPHLGEEARRQDEEDCWFKRDRKEKNVTAFGYTAFTESLLRIGLTGLHSSGISLQAAAPAGVKGLWMIAFLRFQYEKLHEGKSSISLDALDPEVHAKWKASKMARPTSSSQQSQVSTRPGTAASRPDTASSANTRPPTAGSQWMPQQSPQQASTPDWTRAAASGPGTLPRFMGGTTLRLPPGGKAPPKEMIEEVPPAGAKYHWSLSKVLENPTDLFLKGVRTAPETGEAAYIVDPSKALEKCDQCHRRRDHHGLGNIFCHLCSGIDDGTISKSLLFPVCQRRRLKLMMAAAAESQMPYDKNNVNSSALPSEHHDEPGALRTPRPGSDGRLSRSGSKEGDAQARPRRGSVRQPSPEGRTGAAARRGSTANASPRQGSRRGSVRPAVPQ